MSRIKIELKVFTKSLAIPDTKARNARPNCDEIGDGGWILSCPPFDPTAVQAALVRVWSTSTNKGMGFRIGDYIATAAHCLPRMPQNDHMPGDDMFTVNVSTLDEKCECKLFVHYADQNSDLALLGHEIPSGGDSPNFGAWQTLARNLRWVELSTMNGYEDDGLHPIWIPTHEGGDAHAKGDRLRVRMRK